MPETKKAINILPKILKCLPKWWNFAAAAASVGLNLLNNRKRRKNSRNQRTMKKKKRTNWTFQFLKLTSFDAVVVKGTTVGPIEPPAAALALDNNNISNNS